MGETMSDKNYKATGFARRAGVTVRTLHHYDRLGLLKPTARTHAGYRVYTDRDLVRLEQIVALKFVGFPLKEIARVLDGDGDLPTALRAQREIMAAKANQIARAMEAISHAEYAVGREPGNGYDALAKIIEVIEMQDNMEWTNKYYSAKAKAKLARARERDPEIAHRGEKKWAVLLADVDKAIAEGVDPGSDRAQELARRWSELIGEFTQGDPEIAKGLKAFYSDKQNWPSTFQQPFKSEAAQFICAAQAAKK
jgi:MerR family transcriptional regulator, thiopeptide resistance regulator